MGCETLSLRVLGQVSLSGAEESAARALLAAPKRLALLTYLCEADAPVGRDALLGLLWPEEDQPHARNALNQLLYQTRRSLGREVVCSHGSELIAVDHEDLWCDLPAFHRAFEAKRFEAALDLYGGDVLRGYYLPGAPAFERWLEGQRDGTRRQAIESARALAAAVAPDSAHDAARWLHRALAISPYEELQVRELLVVLDEIGDRAGAARVYESFRIRMERDLETRPSPETDALFEKIRARSAARTSPKIRPIPVVPVPERGPTPVPPETPGTTHLAPARLRTALWPAVAIVALAIGLAGLAVWLPVGPRTALSQAELRDDVVLVLPFATRSNDIEYLGEGIVDLLAVQLDGDGVPRAVEPDAAIAAWRRFDTDNWSARVAHELGTATGAGRIIKGSVLPADGGFLLTAELVDARTGDVISSASAEADVAGADGSPGPWNAAAVLAARLLSAELDEGRLLVHGPAPPLEALKDYLAARTAYRRGNLEAALERYRSALERDSMFAYAALGMVETTRFPIVSGGFNEARRHAFSLEHLLRPRDRIYLRALGGANYPETSVGGATGTALAEAHRLLPYRPHVQFQVADRLFHRRQDLAVAAAALGRTLEMDPEFALAIDHLFLLELASGDLEAAEELAVRYRRHYPKSHRAASMAWALARVRGDTTAVQSFWAAAPRHASSILIDVFVWGHFLGAPLDEVRRLADEGARRGFLEPEIAEFYVYVTALNAGRPGDPSSIADNGQAAGHGPIVAFLYSAGDSALAAEAALRVAGEQNLPVGGDKWALALQAHDTCALEQWRMWRGEESPSLERSKARIIEAQRRAPEVEGRQNLHHCVALLEALKAVLDERDDAAVRLATADSIFDLRPSGPQSAYAELLLARLHERMGDPRRALERVRNRCWFCLDGISYRADFLRQEGRLALATGDREEALKAYVHYLVLRADPAPSVRPQVDSVRRELARLSPGDRHKGGVRAP